MRIVIVRHGEPDYEKDCLTIEGRKQAELAAKRLIKEHIEKIYSSPLGRARETAEAFSNLTGMKPAEILDFMKEIRYGREDDLYSEAGHPWSNADKIAAEGKDLRDPNWRELPVFIDNTATVDVDNVIKHTDEWLSGLGYVREGLYYRNVAVHCGVVLPRRLGDGDALAHIQSAVPLFVFCHTHVVYGDNCLKIRFNSRKSRDACAGTS